MLFKVLIDMPNNIVWRQTQIIFTGNDPYWLSDDDIECDPYAGGIVVAEIKTARSKPSGNSNQSNSWCHIKSAMGLPCRYLFSCRIHAGEQILFNGDDVLSRWLIGYDKDILYKRPLQQSEQYRNICRVETASKRARFSYKKTSSMTKDDKFRNMMILCKSMADLFSIQGTYDFFGEI